LVLLNLNGPQTLDSVLGFGVVMSLMGVDLTHAQGEKREGQELEDILSRSAVCHGWEEGVLLCGSFGVSG
jgi:hypothetical protein